jgi:bifunctional UDP-N-acetylglucosamine pyrophosphorylase/glucosamine-1-phosphate N-acetyltransferase
VDALKNTGVSDIVIVGGAHAAGTKNHFRNDEGVRVIEDRNPKGPVFSLCAAKEYISGDFLVLYGDTLVTEGDLKALVETRHLPAVLASPLHGRSGDHITCNVNGDRATGFVGHPRGGSDGHFCAGFAFAESHMALLEANSGRFTNTQVGMMPPLEGFVEMSLNDYIRDGGQAAAIETKDYTVDIDKPWHILEADHVVKKRLCDALEAHGGNILAEGAGIDPGAAINGCVQLGEGSSIGRGAIVNGRVIVGRNSKIRNGAIIHGDCVVGDDTTIENYCYLDDSTVGNRCYIGHGAELGGVIFDKVYLFHYMEISGVVGDNVDFGAATVCGSLRFDDGVTRHRINGRWEEGHQGQDACFVGDYCRTGVNATLMPGVKIGCYSVVGAGVMLNEDVPDRTLVYAEQTLVKKAWGPEKYGW